MSFFNNFQYKSKKSIVFLIWFFKNPIEQIQRLPDWSLRNILIVHFLFSIFSGLLAGVVSVNKWNILFGILIFPFISLILTMVLSTFFYYYFQVFERKTISFIKLLTLIIFANFPFFILQIGSNYIPPISVIGLLFTGMLIIVGLTENFNMEKKRSIRLVGIIWFIILLVWIWNRISVSKMDI
jgi:hypothetical protein